MYMSVASKNVVLSWWKVNIKFSLSPSLFLHLQLPERKTPCHETDVKEFSHKFSYEVNQPYFHTRSIPQPGYHLVSATLIFVTFYRHGTEIAVNRASPPHVIGNYKGLYTRREGHPSTRTLLIFLRNVFGRQVGLP